jgi:hypothetical protein
LYSLDPQSAYQHAFVFIRQLAVILKGALTEKGLKVLVVEHLNSMLCNGTSLFTYDLTESCVPLVLF